MRQNSSASDESRENPTVRVMNGLRRVVRALSASARALPESGGVSGAQLFVLRQIANAPGASVRELAERTLTGQSTVSEVVSRLVDRGLVERGTSARDARQTVLTLTTKGRRATARSETTAQERLAAALDTLPADERETLAWGFERWLAAAGLAETPATMFFEREARSRPRTSASKLKVPRKRSR
jgi:DNA-binding MarR family transcriptional regulator